MDEAAAIILGGINFEEITFQKSWSHIKEGYRIYFDHTHYVCSVSAFPASFRLWPCSCDTNGCWDCNSILSIWCLCNTLYHSYLLFYVSSFFTQSKDTDSLISVSPRSKAQKLLLLVTTFMLLLATSSAILQIKFTLLDLLTAGFNPPSSEYIIPLLTNTLIASNFLDKVNVSIVYICTDLC